jgi:hypothetical protein
MAWQSVSVKFMVVVCKSVENVLNMSRALSRMQTYASFQLP